MCWVVVFILLSMHSSLAFQSNAIISDWGYTFVPIDSTAQPILTSNQRSLIRCYAECNKRIACRTFDYDEESRQCRLWSDDSTTGSISSATPPKPRSKVGTIKIEANIYANSHQQPCNKCVDSRYEICDPKTETCQCPTQTFWNGSVCLPKRYLNQSCSTLDACRSNENLECRDTNCNSIYTCQNRTASNVGLTVAGFCNGTIGGGSQGLSGPWGLYVTSDNALYVTDYDAYRVVAYPSLSRFGVTIMTTANAVVDDVYVDSHSNVYTAVLGAGIIFVSPSNRTFPSVVSNPCTTSSLAAPYGVAVDRQGNIYVSDFSCHMITRWTLNVTVSTVVAGRINVAGSSSQSLHTPKCIYYDDASASLYVVDYNNHRVQKFSMNGNGTGITVAGGYGPGSGLHQLNYPTGVWVSRKDGSIYVGDTYNHRVMKWRVNGTQGSIVAGSTGLQGRSPLLLDTPGDVALDPSETYLYVADYGNHRVQRFRLD